MRWQVATLGILDQLNGLPVTQYSGDQLWATMERRDVWHPADTPPNRMKIGIFLWKLVKANLFPWIMRHALGNRSTPDGQSKYRVDYTFSGEALAHEIDEEDRYRRAALEAEGEVDQPMSGEARSSAAPADVRGESSAIQEDPTTSTTGPE